MNNKFKKDASKSKNEGVRKGFSSVCYMDEFPEYFGSKEHRQSKDHDDLDQKKQHIPCSQINTNTEK